MMKQFKNASFFMDNNGNTSRVKTVLVAAEFILFIYFLIKLRLSELNAAFPLFILFTFLSYLISKKLKDVITGVKISTHVEVLTAYAAMLLYDLKGAIIINFVSYLASLFLKRKKRNWTTEDNESTFVFLIVAYLVEKSAGLFSGITIIRDLGPIFSIVAGLVALTAVESYFESEKALNRYKSQFAQTFWLGYPKFMFLFVLLTVLKVMNHKDVVMSIISVLVCYLVYLVVIAIFEKALKNQRNDYAVLFELLSSLRAKNESEEKQRLLMQDYVRKMLHEANINGKDFDKTQIAAMLHDFGKAGIDIYSFDSIIEDLRTNQGDPLHAERAAVALARMDELMSIAEVLRYHHKYQDKQSLSRTKKYLRLQASILNVAESFAELLVTNEDPIYDERSAFKDLKKGSGWDFDPKALRLLKRVLLKKGIKRF